MGAKLRTQECCVSCKIKCCSVRNKIPSPKTLLIAPFLWLALFYCCQTLKCCCVSILFRIRVPQSPKGMWSSLCKVNFYGESVKKNYYVSSHQKENSMSRIKKKGHYKEIITKLCIVHKLTHSPWDEGGTVIPLRVTSVALPQPTNTGPGFLKVICHLWLSVN